ncbi:MAG: S41 family peptidase [Acetivibrionales bacterium]
MKKCKTAKLILVLTIVLSILLTQPVFVLAAKKTTDINLEYLKSVMDMIKEKHKGEVTDEQLIEGALKGIFDTMDPYTTYYTPEQAEEFLVKVEGIYEGIGIIMSKLDEYIVITKVFSASPAERAGLLQGDKIVSVDGDSVVGMGADMVSSRIQGENGTMVTLGVIRSGYKEILIFDIIRDEIKISPLNYEIKGDVGYIKIDVFNSNTLEYFTEAIHDTDSRNINKIVLDLRNNPGGEVRQAVELAKFFVPAGLITKLEFQSDEDKDIEYRSNLTNPKFKVAVLVNGMSASASEILAGAIQDTGVGKLIGTRTFGKARVQSIIPLLTPEAYEKYREKLDVELVNAYDLILKHRVAPLKSEIIGMAKITTGMYTTPNGRKIDGIGLEPDLYVENDLQTDSISIFNIQKLSRTTKPGINDEGLDVYNAEKILSLLGYEVGLPDYRLDEKTFNAVWKFRVDNGLYPGGILDFTTQEALNDKLDRLILEYDKQYVKALEVLGDT